MFISPLFRMLCNDSDSETVIFSCLVHFAGGSHTFPPNTLFFLPQIHWKHCFVIDSCVGALAVWRSWERLAFCKVRSLAVVSEAVLMLPRSSSHPSVLSHLFPLGIPLASEDLPCWLKHLFPRNPQEKI